MKDVEELIGERARRGELSHLSLAATAAIGKRQALFKASWRNAKGGALSTGEDVDPLKALMLALRGTNAGINRTKKRSDARPGEPAADEGNNFDFG